VWSFVVLFLSCVCVCDLFLFDSKEALGLELTRAWWRRGVWPRVNPHCVWLSLYKIFVHFEAFMYASQSSLYCLPTLALPAIVQYYCTAIAQYTTPPRPPIAYAIHHTILAMSILCKGQRMASTSRGTIAFQVPHTCIIGVNPSRVSPLPYVLH